MDPSLLHPPPSSVSPSTIQQTHQSQNPSEPRISVTSTSNDTKPAITDTDEHPDASGSEDDGDADENGAGGSEEANSKRPRLRLAHACDRCRKRKIRCDTQQPCGPCQATKNVCTFHTPSRRTTNKPKPAESTQRSSSTSGVKRPHSPPRDQTALEARLAALEAMLRDVPPNVHNAFLSSLDARLGGGAGVGLKEGRGDGVGVAPEALTGSGMMAYSNNAVSPLQQWVTSATTNGSLNSRGIQGMNTTGTMGSNETLVPGWTGYGGVTGGHPVVARRQEDEGIDAMAKKMEGMSFFYEDEIGQAKWQGE